MRKRKSSVKGMRFEYQQPNAPQSFIEVKSVTDAAKEVRGLLLDVLNSSNEPAVKIAAFGFLTSGLKSEPVNISDCTFSSGGSWNAVKARK